MNHYDIFISYRREGGEAMARLLYDRMERLGYCVFLDVEGLRSGQFNKALYDVIDNCTDFLLILPDRALERCQEPSDWVRLEIERAVNKNKNIIPVMMRNFTFPDDLPPTLCNLPYYQGISANMEYFDAVIDRLVKMHIKSVPRNRVSSGEMSVDFRNLLLSTYDKMVALRESLRKADMEGINLGFRCVEQSMQQIFLVQEKTQFSDESISKASANIVNEYNQFVTVFNRWNVSKTNEDALEAEQLYNSIIKLLLMHGDSMK